jgi:hypothetical protein
VPGEKVPDVVDQLAPPPAELRQLRPEDRTGRDRLRAVAHVGELRASDQVAEVGGDIEGEIDPNAVHAGAARAGDRPTTG